MKPIDKAVIVAEIERLKTIYNDDENIHHIAKYNILVDILSFLNTLEVKEVDLEKEIDDAFLENKCNITDNVSLAEFARIAKHFFKLGFKAQKGEGV